MSVALNWDVDLGPHFPNSEDIRLPHPAPALAGYTVIVTGSGTRLRDLSTDPADNLGAVVVHDGGTSGTLHYRRGGNFRRPTSEFNSHLAVHQDQVAARKIPFHALMHAQPPHLVMLSHLPTHSNFTDFNRAVFRWQPETIVHLPEGIGYLPFMLTGSEELMEGNVRVLTDHQVALWQQHGVMARSDVSLLGASDMIEYAETGAMYEQMNLTLGSPAPGLTDAELRSVIKAFNVSTTLYSEDPKTPDK